MKNIKRFLALLTALALLFAMTACNNGGTDDSKDPVDTNSIISTDASGNDVEITVEDLKGVTDTTIYVGNTAGTTGALATIGEPFNLGIQAAFAAYNAAGGFNGLKVELKHYDDGGDATQTVTLTEQLIFDDEVFAIVGNFGSYAVAANLDIITDEGVPMVYAAAGNDVLYNAAAEGNAKAVFPVQPLNHTEGQMLILRAFAPNDKGGMGATKVGVLSNTDEASQTMLAGIKKEAEASGLTAKIVYQNVSGDDFSAAINAFKDAGCNTVVIAVTGSYFTNALVAMANANYYAPVLTTYNNASASVLNDATTVLKSEYEAVLSNIPIFAQAWLDITSTDHNYNNTEHGLYQTYASFGLAVEGTGVAGFSAEYWTVAENIFDYCTAAGRADGFAMSYNSYALAGYIAGDLFCQGLEALEASGKALTRANFIEIMESQEFQVAMADAISFADGVRSGVQSFALTMFYDAYEYNNGAYHSASSVTVSGLVSMDEFREMLAE